MDCILKTRTDRKKEIENSTQKNVTNLVSKQCRKKENLNILLKHSIPNFVVEFC